MSVINSSCGLNADSFGKISDDELTYLNISCRRSGLGKEFSALSLHNFKNVNNIK